MAGQVALLGRQRDRVGQDRLEHPPDQGRSDQHRDAAGGGDTARVGGPRCGRGAGAGAGTAAGFGPDGAGAIWRTEEASIVISPASIGTAEGRPDLEPASFPLTAGASGTDGVPGSVLTVAAAPVLGCVVVNPEATVVAVCRSRMSRSISRRASATTEPDRGRSSGRLASSETISASNSSEMDALRAAARRAPSRHAAS